MNKKTSPLNPLSKVDGAKAAKKMILSLLLMILSVSAFAQDNETPVEMATGLYQSGKIYVVVAVLSIIFIGITGYLIMLDRKIGKLEKEIRK